ncbi:MAG: MoxR family ATPase, partial [Planctomycetota bacterium]
SGYRSRSVKQEMRENLIAKLRAGDTVFEGIVGYDETVFPQIVHAILSRHDMVLLGLRGQAKTRIVRSLPALLDDYTPTLAGAELPDDPLDPQFTRTKAILAERGDDAELHWIHRSERYHEKLATPDVTIADLIGEIDLVKHAEGRYLADETVMHFGLVPRTNRGIFAINELPDLAPRIQVGLFNVLEERDVQIRGFPVRLPLDICLVFTANPEDYTSRGRIVTPLKDRIGSVVRTHYPASNEDGIEIAQQNAWMERNGDGQVVDVPPYMMEIVEEVARLARKSPHINQQSGVSVRASIANVENMISSAERRGLLCGEKRVVPRIDDLAHIAASTRGKIELMLAEDDSSEEKLITSLIGEAVKNVYANYGELSELQGIVEAFGGGQTTLQIGDEVPGEVLVDSIAGIGDLAERAASLCELLQRDPGDAANLASAAGFILEALYVNNRLSKYVYRGKTYLKR